MTYPFPANDCFCHTSWSFIACAKHTTSNCGSCICSLSILSLLALNQSLFAWPGVCTVLYFFLASIYSDSPFFTHYLLYSAKPQTCFAGYQSEVSHKSAGVKATAHCRDYSDCSNSAMTILELLMVKVAVLG